MEQAVPTLTIEREKYWLECAEGIGELPTSVTNERITPFNELVYTRGAVDPHVCKEMGPSQPVA